MTFDTTFVLILASATVNGLLAGASLDQSIKQLPARHKIGHIAYSRYSRAADLGYGVPLYAILGIGAALLAISAALFAYRDGVSSVAGTPLYFGTTLAVLHSLVTTQAVPTIFSQRKVVDNGEALTKVFAKFERWQTLRCTLQVIAFGVALWGLVAYVASR